MPCAASRPPAQVGLRCAHVPGAASCPPAQVGLHCARVPGAASQPPASASVPGAASYPSAVAGGPALVFSAPPALPPQASTSLRSSQDPALGCCLPAGCLRPCPTWCWPPAPALYHAPPACPQRVCARAQRGAGHLLQLSTMLLLPARSVFAPVPDILPASSTSSQASPSYLPAACLRPRRMWCWPRSRASRRTPTCSTSSGSSGTGCAPSWSPPR